jgi:hypothetical protein
MNTHALRVRRGTDELLDKITDAGSPEPLRGYTSRSTSSLCGRSWVPASRSASRSLIRPVARSTGSLSRSWSGACRKDSPVSGSDRTRVQKTEVTITGGSASTSLLSRRAGGAGAGRWGRHGLDAEAPEQRKREARHKRDRNRARL